MVMRASLVLPAVLLVAILAFFLAFDDPTPPVQAGIANEFAKDSLSDLGKYVVGDKPLNLRLVALEQLRKKSGSESQLKTVALGNEKAMAIFATTALGKKKTTAAKTALKDVLESTSAATTVRAAALNAIAEHFKDADDLSYLWSKAKGNDELEARYNHVKTSVYRR